MKKKAKKSPKKTAKKSSVKVKVKKKNAESKPTAPKLLKPTPRVSKAEWGPIRRMLLEKRNSTLETMRKIKDHHNMGADVGDEADQAGALVEKELQFELSDNERNQLDQIEGALRKMDKETYGLCEQCRKPINKLRIKALPFARYCIECQSRSERAVF